MSTSGQASHEERQEKKLEVQAKQFRTYLSKLQASLQRTLTVYEKTVRLILGNGGLLLFVNQAIHRLHPRLSRSRAGAGARRGLAGSEGQ